MVDERAARVLNAARQLTRDTKAPLVLAVSGGIDSMALLRAMIAVAPERIAAVATFDHGSGPVATRAARHVARAARAAGLRVGSGRFDGGTAIRDGREAAWRDARYRFLRAHAERLGARVVTAHTRDDQVETVLMRVMRGSGARGLAGLYAPTDVLRPFLDVGRDDILAYASAARLEWVEDPGNASPEFTRNRIRHDILPALRRADRAFDRALLDIAQRAASWRGDVDRIVRERVRPTRRGDGSLAVARAELAGHDGQSLAMLWSSLAASVGLSLDHRGTRRIAAFTRSEPRAGTIPLAGGWCVEATHDVYILTRTQMVATRSPVALPMDEQEWIEWGAFRFRLAPSPASATGGVASVWSASIRADAAGVVRAWGAGDRLEPASGQPRRRVTRYFSDVGVHGSDRSGWPVVVAGEEVVWIPGVRRSDAATDRSGWPVRHYICERIDR
jgi:tRNA(Ile)-lysidine synthase